MTPSFDTEISSKLNSDDWSKEMSSAIIGKHRHQVRVKRWTSSALTVCLIAIAGVLFTGNPTFTASTTTQEDDTYLLDRSVATYYSSIIDESDNLLAFDTIYF